MDQEREEGRFHIPKFIVIILVIVIGFVGFNFARTQIMRLKSDKPANEQPVPKTYTRDLSSYRDYVGYFKDEPSDIEGKTKLDKYEMGLLIDDGSDTDGDGLTDKDEVEKYGSDPLKYSTAGDLYSDKWKVDNNYNPSDEVESSDEPVFLYNECPEVTLYAKEAKDLNANVFSNSVEGKSINELKLYADYMVLYYSGEVTIDLSEALPDDVTSKDISVFYADGMDSDNLKMVGFYRDDDRTITIKKRKNSDCGAFYITEKTSKFKTVFNNYALILLDEEDVSHRMVFVSGSPILAYLHLAKMKVIVEMNPSDDETSVYTWLASNLQKNWINPNFWGEGYEEFCLDYYEPKNLDGWQMLSGYIALDNLMGVFNANGRKWYHNLYSYYMVDDMDQLYIAEGFFKNSKTMIYHGESRDDSDDSASEDEPEAEPEIVAETTDPSDAKTEKKKKKHKKVTCGFETSVDAFPFYNISTNFSDGNCAGISYLTTDCYNTKGLTDWPAGTYDLYYDFDGEGNYKTEQLQWDLTKNKEDQTILDPGLSDYKSRYYYYDKYGGDFDNDGYLEMDLDYFSNLEDEDREFISLVSAFQDYANNGIEREFIVGGTGFDRAIIDSMIKKIDNGRALLLSLNTPGGLAHDVVAYGYKKKEKGSEYDIAFYLYDCNFPTGTLDVDGDGTYETLNLKLHVKYTELNGKDSFYYYYNPYYGIDAQKGIDEGYYARPLFEGETHEVEGYDGKKRTENTYEFGAYVVRNGKCSRITK